MNKEKVLAFFRHLFRKDLGMKLAALGVAAVMWLFVIAQENPSRFKEFDGIPVTFTGTEELAARGLTVSENYADILASATVGVEAQISQLQHLTENDLTASVDLSGITEPGEYTLRVRAGTQSGSVTSIKPDRVTLTVENIATRELPVSVSIIGDRQENLYYGDILLSEDTVTISGAQSKIERCAKALCEVDVTGAQTTIQESRTIKLLDSAGNDISAEYDFALPTVIVKLPVLPTKIFTIDTELIRTTVSGIEEGYEVQEISVSPTEVTLAGEQSVLDGVSQLSLEPIVLDNASVDAVQKVAIHLPEGAYAVTPPEITVTLKIGLIQEERVYESRKISVYNLEDGLSASLNPKTVDVTVRGTQEQLDAVTQSKIKPYVDLTGLTVGVHTATVKFDGEADIDATLIPSNYTVEVTITAE